MARRAPSSSLQRLTGASVALVVIVGLGTFGYWSLTGRRYPLLDCVYMTVITITTVGFGEIIDLSHNPSGRILTMLIAVGGLGILTYMLSTFTAFILEGELTERFRRSVMEKKAAGLKDHYIVCGAGTVGQEIVRELHASGRPCVVIDTDAARLHALAQTFENIVVLDGDATDNDVLLMAGVARARGLFAATAVDHQNLVLSLSAKQLSPHTTVVARCQEMKNADKLRAAGADHVVSPSFIGGLRMASEMVRPTVVSFLDLMLRDRERNLRIEEVSVGGTGRRIADLELHRFRNTLLLAVRQTDHWTYNPPSDHRLDADSRLIVMTTPQDRLELERCFGTPPPGTE